MSTVAAWPTDFRSPAGDQPVARRPGADTVIPGGRIVHPYGEQHFTGPNPFGLAVSPDGNTIITADGGVDRFSLTAMNRSAQRWQIKSFPARGEEEDWRSVYMGLAFDGDDQVYASEGASGVVRRVSPSSGKLQTKIELNQGGLSGSIAAEIVFDRRRGILYVLDPGNGRVVVFDTKRRRLVGSAPAGRIPFAAALSPNGERLYVTNVGASANAPESNALGVFDVADPANPKLLKWIKTGLDIGEAGAIGGASPSGVVSTNERIFVSNAHNDTVTVIDAFTLLVLQHIPLRITGLENLRGFLPGAMAYHAPTGWLLVAEAGLNAIGVIDPRRGRVLGHIPAGWFPSRVVIDGNRVYVTNAKGAGTGPTADKAASHTRAAQVESRRGTLQTFLLPKASDLEEMTDQVLAYNGAKLPRTPSTSRVPDDIRHVVLIAKRGRTFDEMFGDIESVSNGEVRGAPELARFGRRGRVDVDRRDLQTRFSQKYVNVAPNHRDLALKFAFSDNFYSDGERGGDRWLAGIHPNVWSESTGTFVGSIPSEEQPERGSLWNHLERNQISFRVYGSAAGRGFDLNTPDQVRADRFIKDIDENYVAKGAELPRFVYVNLPNDQIGRPRPSDGYPFAASYVADNDYALGRIVEYLSHSKWWPNMAIFVTEEDARGGVDHVDSQRTLLLAIGPHVKKNYVSRVNASYPALFKTIFRTLDLPPLNLFDALASDLTDMFTDQATLTPHTLLPVNAELFDPVKAKAAQ